MTEEEFNNIKPYSILIMNPNIRNGYNFFYVIFSDLDKGGRKYINGYYMNEKM